MRDEIELPPQLPTELRHDKPEAKWSAATDKRESVAGGGQTQKLFSTRSVKPEADEAQIHLGIEGHG